MSELLADSTAERASRHHREIPPLDRIDGLLLSILVMEVAALSLLHLGAQRFGDLNFYTEAKALASALRDGAGWSEVAVNQGPAPVVYYAIPFLAVPPGSADRAYWWAAFIWNVWWVMVALWCLRRAAGALAGPAAGMAAGALVLAAPFSVYYSFGIDAEPPAYLGAAILAYAWATRRERRQDAAVPWLGGVGLALFLLSRPNAVLLLAVLGLAILLLSRRPGGRADARRMRRLVVLAAAGTIVVTAVARLLPSTAGGSPQLANLSHVLFHGRFQYRSEPFDWRYWDNETRRGSADYSAWARTQDSLVQLARGTGTPISSLRWRWIWKDLREHPGITIQSAGVRLLTLNLAFVNSRSPAAFRLGPLSGYVVYGLFHLAVNLSWLTVLALCLWHAVRRWGDLASEAPLWGPWVALLTFHIFTYAEARYLFPGQPGLVVLAAGVLGSAWQPVRSDS